MRPGERQPVPDPRLFLKNFGMPMNTALTGEMLVGDIRRKEAEAITPRAPSVIAGMGGDGAVERKFREFNSVPPLFCTLIRKANGDRFVTVSEGCVAEVIPQSSGDDEDEIENRDGVQEHPIGDPDNPGSGIWQQEFPNLLQEHGPITEGQVVGIAFTTTKEGYIDSPLTIEVRDYENRVSTHYQPPVGLDDGAPGDAFYVLARLVGSGDTEKLEIWHAGSNIDYVHDTPPFVKMVGAGEDLFEKYNLQEGQYEYLGLKQIYPILLHREQPDLQIHLNGADLDLKIVKFTLETEPDIPTPFPVNFDSSGEQYTEVDGEHEHKIESHEHNGTVLSTNFTTQAGFVFQAGALTGVELTRTGKLINRILPGEWEDDGRHMHKFNLSNLSGTVTIPVRGRTYARISTEKPEVYVYRCGAFIGIFPETAKPPRSDPRPTGPVPYYNRTQYVFDGGGGTPM